MLEVVEFIGALALLGMVVLFILAVVSAFDR